MLFALAAWVSKPCLQPAGAQLHVHAENDELAPVRQRIRQYGLRTAEEKILTQLRKFKAEEDKHLERFARAEREGAVCLPSVLPAACPPARLSACPPASLRSSFGCSWQAGHTPVSRGARGCRLTMPLPPLHCSG